MTNRLGGRALVVGGGMCGLFAARVAAPHFDEVIVVDRDTGPVDATPRNGVPQGSHFHVLLPGGLSAMEQWFPGFTDDLVALGSIPMAVGGTDFVAYTALGKSYSIQSHQPEPMDPIGVMYVQTRPLLELAVRRRVAELANVRFRYDTIVEAPLEVDGRVGGALLRGGERVEADLVIDASGRNSLTPRWLTALGHPTAPETYVNCDVHYASVMVQPDDWSALEPVVTFVMPTYTGDHPSRFGAMVRMDGGRWLVGLGSRYGESPPTDWDGYLAFGRGLHHPIWSELVGSVTPLEPIRTYRLPRAVRHHYEQLSTFPEGLVPIGDAVCFFNPTHGQGMSAGAGQCRGLEEVLARRAEAGAGLDGLALEFFPIAADWVRGPWITAAVGDFGHPDCTGDFPNDDLPDLMRLGELAATATTPDARDLVMRIATLQLPLSAVHATT